MAARVDGLLLPRCTCWPWAVCNQSRGRCDSHHVRQAPRQRASPACYVARYFSGGFVGALHLPALLRARDLIAEVRPPRLTWMRWRARRATPGTTCARLCSGLRRPPRTYLTRRRVERAKSLLRVANLSVTEVCFMVGFESLGSFSALFKRLVGQSPSSIRQPRRGPAVHRRFQAVWC